MRNLLAVIAGLLAVYGYIPYAIDTLKGKARPARASRLMFAILLVITLLQQEALHSGWLVAMTVGEAVGSLGILMLALKRGVGGFTRSDKLCYGLLLIDVALWLSTGNALLALHLSILADIIAFTPTLLKTWRDPFSETPLFFVFGTVAGPLNIIATGRYQYAVILFPLYIAVANLFEIVLITSRQKKFELARV